MSSLYDALKVIRKEYFSYEEFPLQLEHLTEYKETDALMGIADSRIEQYACQLTGHRLEQLLLELANQSEQRKIKKIAEVLRLRASERICILLAFLAQYNYQSESLRYLSELLTHEEKLSEIKHGKYLEKFSSQNNPMKVLCDVLEHECHSMHELCEEYGISERSPFALESFLLCSSTCTKTVLLANIQWMNMLTDQYEPMRLAGMIRNYLTQLNLVEYDDELNDKIVDLIGEPNTSPDWKVYPIALRDKFAQWSYLYRAKRHCEGEPEKFRMLVKYFEYVKNNREIEEIDALISDFGWIVLTDIKGRKDAYLYEKSRFEKEMNAWHEDEAVLPGFVKGDYQTLTGREFMLSTRDSDCIRLDYEDIHYYYFDEVMDIKIGIVPDMRELSLKKYGEVPG